MTKSQSISIKAANAGWVSLGVAFLCQNTADMPAWYAIAILCFVLEHIADKD